MPLQAGIYEHYKHHLYRVLGLGHWDTTEGLDWNRTQLLGVAHYSEDADQLALVVAPQYETGENQLAIFGLNGVPDWGDDWDGPLVVYLSLYAPPPGESTPRMCLRPYADHPEAWTTAKYIPDLNRQVERFRYVENPWELPRMADRHEWGTDDQAKTCQRCGAVKL